MIRGVVNGRREAVVRLRIYGPAGTEADVDAVVDTGFSGMLTLPHETIATLGLVSEMTGIAALADGAIVEFDYYTADVDWGGERWSLQISGVGGNETLVGMRLLAGHELRVAVESGGVVEISPLP